MLDEKLTQSDLVQWVQVIRTPSIGARTFWQLLHTYGSMDRVLEYLHHNGKDVCSRAMAEEELANHQKRGFHLIAAFMPEFPQHLRSISDCPPVISVYGQLDYLNKKTLAIVGARNASMLGRQFAEKLAVELGKEGWVIASGLARGIDRYAHVGGLASGTVAVIAGGIDNIYPPEHAELYHRIAQQGAVVSEMPLGMHPGAVHFPRRNRIISGMSRGVIVVEAALKSGSLITARYASEQNRDLFAVPGSPFDPRCRGTNDLLKNGAILTESPQDVLNALQDRKRCLQESPLEFIFESPEQDNSGGDLAQLILQDLSATPISIDLLIQEHGVSAQRIQNILQELEISGKIQRHSNGAVSCVLSVTH